jgi:hypothetical protein
MDGMTANEVANIDIRGLYIIRMLKDNLEMWQNYTGGTPFWGDEFRENLTALINQTNEYLHALNVGGDMNIHLFSPAARLPWAVRAREERRRRLATILEPI